MSVPETTSLLFEIGCEEMPARFLEGAERELGDRLGLALREARLLSQDAAVVKTASTPRRLMAYVPALLARQPSRVEQIVGPPVSVAFDKEGKPTRAADSFTAKNNASVSDLKRVTTAKGEYVALDVSELGKPTLQVLVEVLPTVIGSLSFPKNMYWTAKAGPLFVRPIRWILALLGEEGSGSQVVPFEFAGVKSGNLTYGHRLQGNRPVVITDLNLDLLLEKHLVIVSGSERRERVKRDIKVLLEGTHSAATPDEFLETWVVNSTEWPAPLMGSFDARYLDLPREVLVTVMRDHQKYFAMEDEAGNLQPHFITVLNVPGDPKGLIRQGHERVLAARFADAEFFWKADQKVSLSGRIPMLERVTYQAKLGTYADKVRRMKSIAVSICATLEEAGRLTRVQRDHALRAVELCKCDLTTQMVQEFTELQGIMGGLYAKAQGEPVEVAEAIYDHYRPVGIGDSCPRSVAGAVVSLADKLDGIIAGFSVGLEPTGSSDPFGLRRAGNGIIKVLVESKLPLRLRTLLQYAQSALGGAGSDHLVLHEFLTERLAFYLEKSLGLRYDTVRAVFAGTDWKDGAGMPDSPFAVAGNCYDAALRAKALEQIRDTDDFRSLAVAAKRTRNILSKSASQAEREAASNPVKPWLFREEAERELDAERAEAWDKVNNQLSYSKKFESLAELRLAVDRFFNEVMVMTDDINLRLNRLALLRQLDKEAFSYLADLSEIVPFDVGAPTSNITVPEAK